MIKSFLSKGFENFFHDGTKKGIQPKHANKIGEIVDRLDAATVIRDMDFPGSSLHKLDPKKKGKWAVNDPAIPGRA